MDLPITTRGTAVRLLAAEHLGLTRDTARFPRPDALPLGFVLALEMQLGIDLDDADIEQCKTLGDVVALVEGATA